jgi:hypothetical protein
MRRMGAQTKVYFTRSALEGALTQYIAALKPYLTEAFHLELMEVRGADGKARRFFKATDSTNLGFPARRANKWRILCYPATELRPQNQSSD